MGLRFVLLRRGLRRCVGRSLVGKVGRRVGRREFVILEQDAVSGPVEVVELTRFQSPEKREQAEKSEQESGRDQEQQNIHRPQPRFSRSEFVVTRSEDADMAMAAPRGVTSPAIASGTVTAL